MKSTSPLQSVSNISITRWTSGFCCSSGSDMNSSTDNAPLPSKSNFLNLRASLRISSASTIKKYNYSMQPKPICWLTIRAHLHRQRHFIPLKILCQLKPFTFNHWSQGTDKIYVLASKSTILWEVYQFSLINKKKNFF